MIRRAAIVVAITLLAVGSWVFFHPPVGLASRAKARADADSTRRPMARSEPRRDEGAQINNGSHKGIGTKSTGISPGNSIKPQKRPWDSNFFAELSDAVEGQPIQFELVGGKFVEGKVLRLKRSGTNVTYLSGELSQPQAGRFFFQAQDGRGIAGAFVGVVEFGAGSVAYRIEPSEIGENSHLVERPLQQVRCVEFPQLPPRRAATIAEAPPLNSAEFPAVPTPGYQNGIAVLESLAGAVPVIYLDFQGGYIDSSWGGIAYQPSAFTSGEIREIWQRVAEDYLPFNINVTTDLGVFKRAAGNSRQHVIVTPTDTADPGAGGAAYVGSFNWTGDTPCWVFVTNAPHFCAEACSHEAGHTLGLVHDGQQINGTHFEYYEPHGTSETSWAPIMGTAYYARVTQWSKGEYLDANNLEDQLAMLVTQNNVHYRADDTGDTLASSRYLETYPDASAGAEGVIERTGDTDAFQFTTAGGLVSLRADPAGTGPNLAVQVGLYDAADTLIATDNPQNSLWAALSTNLPAGTYTFRVSGAGRNNPLTTGFSAYASLGYYSITGQVTNPRLPDRFAVPENAPIGTLVGTLRSWAPNGEPLRYEIVSGNRSNTFAIGPSGGLFVTNNATLDYELLARGSTMPVEFELLVNILDSNNPVFNETNRRVLIAVNNRNEPPIITGFSSTNMSGLFFGLGGFGLGGFSAWPGFGEIFESNSDSHFTSSVLEHSGAGTGVGRLIGSDPDAYTLLSYTILAGNSNGMFEIDSETGNITVAGDPVAAQQNLYTLTVVLSDQTPPVPLTATSTVSISVQLPFRRGGIAYTIYTNINGTSISALTNAPEFPFDPAFAEETQIAEMISTEEGPSGTVMRGYLLPPVSGNYTFWLASQDDSELWLGTSTNPASMKLIAHFTEGTNWAGPGDWTSSPSQKSETVTLGVGYAYYIEARSKAGTASNYLGVAWESPGNSIARQIVPGEYLSPFHLNYVPHVNGFTANLARNAIAGTQVGRITVSDANSDDVESLTLLAADPPGVFSLDPTNGAVRLVDEAALADASRSDYTLTVQATDNGSPLLSGTARAVIHLISPDTISAQSLRAEIWTNLPGTSVSNLTSDAKFPQRPDLLHELDSLELTSMGFANFGGGILFTNSGTVFGGFGFSNWIGSADNPRIQLQVPSPVGILYGTRIRGYLTPTNTGLFTFFLSSADDSMLLFSPTTNPSEAQTLASITGATAGREWTKFNSQQSIPQWLNAGSNYYIEVLAKTGPGLTGGATGGGLGGILLQSYGHVEVAWTGPGLPETNVIDGAFLGPIDLEYSPILPDLQLTVPITAANGTILSILKASDSPAETLAYKILSGNVSNTFLLNGYSGELSVMDNTSFANYAVTNFELRVQAQDSGYGGLYPLRAGTAAIKISVIDNSPAFVWSGQGENNNWSTASNWDRSLPNDRGKLVFIGQNHLTNANDFLASAGLVTLGTAGFYLMGNPLLLRGGIVNRANNTWDIPSTLDGPQSFTCTSGTLEIANSINNGGNLLTLDGAATVVMDGSISGSGGLAKQGAGLCVVGGTNNYTGPTFVRKGTLAITNTGSLGATSTIDVALGATLNLKGSSTTYVLEDTQTLQGNGMVIGPILVKGKLAPTFTNAFFSTAAMVMSNRVTLAGVTQLGISKNNSYSQTLRVAGELDLGGALRVTMVTNGFPLLNGDSFSLFDANKITGGFAQLNLPPGFVWDTSLMTNTGVIRVAGFVSEAVPILPVVYTNGAVNIRFATTLGRQYDVQTTYSLQPPVRWTTAISKIGNGKEIAITFGALETQPVRYFRVRMR